MNTAKCVHGNDIYLNKSFCKTFNIFTKASLIHEFFFSNLTYAQKQMFYCTCFVEKKLIIKCVFSIFDKNIIFSYNDNFYMPLNHYISSVSMICHVECAWFFEKSLQHCFCSINHLSSNKKCFNQKSLINESF